ncbi:MAG: hypothetical protein NT120_03615 [Candidatus Aenigmarchaeota archaeon]|nr:hypothetical protein [Candidatus Aenigmarchaeota archaeon]
MERNNAFFGAHETWFLTIKEVFGEDAALKAMTTVMERNLKIAYDGMDPKPKKGDPYDFDRVVGGRDNSVGLDVKFPVISESRIVYQFWTDPFPGLKNHVPAEKLDATYMKFKVSYLLGPEWTYRTTMHIWKSAFTEHVIEKK